MTGNQEAAADLGAVAARLAGTLPWTEMENLGRAAAAGPAAVDRLRAEATTGHFRSACNDILQLLPTSPALLVSGALLGAAHALRRERDRLSVDVVWTGPASVVSTARLTSTVVVELIDSARRELLLISFATHAEPTIETALTRARARGVFVTLLLERTADNARFNDRATPFPTLDARRLTWPAHQRPAGAAVHAKVIVVDKETALVGSANLTGHALDRNLECGLLIRGGRQPAEIHGHINALFDDGQLTSL